MPNLTDSQEPEPFFGPLEREPEALEKKYQKPERVPPIEYKMIILRDWLGGFIKITKFVRVVYCLSIYPK